MTGHIKQAEDFLNETGTTLTIKEAEKQEAPHWEINNGLNSDRHIKYIVTLKNKYHSYTFDYWGSINDWEKVHLDGCAYNSLRGQKLREEVKPNAYDILACIYPMYEDDFADWCTSFGYDTDSMKAHETYLKCVEQDRNIRKLFNRDEIEKLSEIQ
jgi:hypothetical protein